MSEEEKKAAGISPPVQGLIFNRATSGTAAALDLSAYVGRFVTVAARTTELFVMCGSTSALADDLDDTATTGANQCFPVPAGTSISFIVSGAYPFLGYKTASAAGFVVVAVTSARI